MDKDWKVKPGEQAKRDSKRWKILYEEARGLIDNHVPLSKRALSELKQAAPSNSKYHKRPANWTTLTRKGIGNMKEVKSGKAD